MKLVSQFGMQLDDATNLIESIVNGGVSLLLGAGASYGAFGGDKQELKGGADLAKELNLIFKQGLVEPDASNLPLVYGDIEGQSALKPRLNTFLKNRFHGCRPTWQSELFKFNWKRIWSLNIDDVLEKARPRSDIRDLNQHLWCDPLRPRSLNGSELQTIYLHGKASELDKKPDHLIFSIKEYAARPENSLGWHTEFRSDFVKKPFIVCGARLQEEFDLITVLEFGNRSRERGGCPSVVILREFAPGQAERFVRQGLIPVTANGDVFFKALLDDINNWKLANPSESEDYVVAKADISAKFKQLKTTELRPKRILDFYASAETQWFHIIDNLDAEFYAARTTADWLSEGDDISVRVSLISGGEISGKTAAAFRISEKLISRGFDVWVFRAEERFSEDSLLKFVEGNKKMAFVFDDCADFSGSLGSLIAKAKNLRRKLRIVATCDSARLRAVKADVFEADLKVFSLEPLHKSDFKELFTKRSQKGRLGRCSNSTQNESWKEFSSHYNQRLLEWLESLENAHPYRDAIVNILSDSSSSSVVAKNLICATAAVHRFGYSLPFHVADDYIVNKSLEMLVADGEQLDQLGYLDDKGIRLRSSAFSKFVWEKMGRDDKYSWSHDIAIKLSPLIVPQNISRRTLAYLIVKGLMDWEVVKRDMQDRAEDWYASLESAYGWNARFWEQRALLASDCDQESKAYSYSKTAVNVHGSDPFPHTTLGKICIKIGLARADSVGVDRFWEGVRALETSRKLALEKGHEWEHPYITFFTYALRAIGLPHFSSERSNLLQSWTEWMRSANKSRTLTFDDTGRSSLEEYQQRWLVSAVSPRP